MFDALDDMGDPVGAARHVRSSMAPDGTWLIVEPYAGEHPQDNHNPLGRAVYGFSTLFCTPTSLARRTRARRTSRRDPDPPGSHRQRVHPHPASRRNTAQPHPGGPALTDARITGHDVAAHPTSNAPISPCWVANNVAAARLEIPSFV